MQQFLHAHRQTNWSHTMHKSLPKPLTKMHREDSSIAHQTTILSYLNYIYTFYGGMSKLVSNAHHDAVNSHIFTPPVQLCDTSKHTVTLAYPLGPWLFEHSSWTTRWMKCSILFLPPDPPHLLKIANLQCVEWLTWGSSSWSNFRWYRKKTALWVKDEWCVFSLNRRLLAEHQQIVRNHNAAPSVKLLWFANKLNCGMCLEVEGNGLQPSKLCQLKNDKMYFI